MFLIKLEKDSGKTFRRSRYDRRKVLVFTQAPF
jgi:hypothetical protein